MANRARSRTDTAATGLAPASSTISSTMKFLLAPPKVSSVDSTIQKQANIIALQVHNSLRAMVNQVIGGVWKGDGATRFAEEMTNLVMPQMDRLTGIIGITGGQADHAVVTMQNADNQARKIASSLNDTFKGIYH